MSKKPINLNCAGKDLKFSFLYVKYLVKCHTDVLL